MQFSCRNHFSRHPKWIAASFRLIGHVVMELWLKQIKVHFGCFIENRHFSSRHFRSPISITFSYSRKLFNTLFESLEPVLLTRVKKMTVWPLVCPWLVKKDHLVLIDQPRTYEWSNGPVLNSGQKYRFQAFEQGIDVISGVTKSDRNRWAKMPTWKVPIFNKTTKMYLDLLSHISMTTWPIDLKL